MSIKNQQGFTLIEILVYSALFAFMMAGTLGAVYMIVQGADRTSNRVTVEDEANFLLRKLDWAISGITSPSSIIIPSAGLTSGTLTVNKPGLPVSDNPLRFSLSGGDVLLSRGTGANLALDSQNVTAASLSFSHIPVAGSKPAALKVVFYLNDIKYETTKYLRK
ncbi:MAG: prepilin-type N-terminal cleavage/methylation domain-containing protein [Candidatus Yanofskybacteria bacterium]|nr:prepilin-type N-terminal cleavage/methylation domain-containing protein [Candidatus Yanofskybacteria bacterium]